MGMKKEKVNTWNKHIVLSHLPGGVFFAGGLKCCTDCSSNFLFLPDSDEGIDDKYSCLARNEVRKLIYSYLQNQHI